METGETGALLEKRGVRAWRRAQRSRLRGVHALGLLALVAWLWAVGLAFLPVSHEYRNGETLHCGSPVFYETVGSQNDRSCDNLTDSRMRDAVGVGLATVPLSVVWLWRAVGIRLQRMDDRP
ncbi:hypothetical protein ABTX81_36640 [Kitasatospora sp. NPDC097605]|uniref:hypothetical protein n=1 Tax=Kitasatospora sp. NPDC097605 TaxID=3157226 RepID=UPI003328CA2A